MKSSLKINKNGTIRATGAAADALFHAMTDPQPDKAEPKAIVTPVFSEYTADDGGYYIRDNDGFKLAEVFVGQKADLIVRAVNEHAALEAVAEAAKDLKEQRDYLYAFLNGFVIPHEVADDPKEFVEQVDKIAAKAREVLNTCRIRGDHSDALSNLASIRGQKAGGK